MENRNKDQVDRGRSLLPSCDSRCLSSWSRRSGDVEAKLEEFTKATDRLALDFFFTDSMYLHEKNNKDFFSHSL